ncbi:hypothetical protein Rsub_01418 [Raphidocelis subcapitata]|uniref:Uncharacterized protein n=1 Tax=Raphidocelis subcapitata TaxID=307507 RepID=A0A2V0NNU6_9CHLO|nr:hypothetical protein Rsub_01418 [Raphidocelis subcapitata]|eukprot:GBF88919.1 hypothetical protein Rsub_01418 [Raphidocelis subcapitata]
MRVAAALVLVLACASHLVSAYPAFFAREELGCVAHPQKRYRKHGAPVADTVTRFVVTDVTTGKPAASVCPGTAYNVTVSFPEKRLAMLTVSNGNFSEPGDEECPNRVFFDRSQGFTAQTSHSMPLVVPCKQATPLVLKLTSATDSTAAYQAVDATLPLGAACAPVTCAQAAAALTALKSAAQKKKVVVPPSNVPPPKAGVPGAANLYPAGGLQPGMRVAEVPPGAVVPPPPENQQAAGKAAPVSSKAAPAAGAQTAQAVQPAATATPGGSIKKL